MRTIAERHTILHFLLKEKPSLQHCYEMGLDCAKNGPNETNCHFSLFRSPEHTKAWEQGKAEE